MISHNVYNVGVIEARHCGLSLMGQGETYSQAQCHCHACELAPNGLLFAADRPRFPYDSDDFDERLSRQAGQCRAHDGIR